MRCAFGDGASEVVFGVAAAGDEEGAHGDGEGFVKFCGGFAEGFRILLAEDFYGDGIIEDAWERVVDLMGGAAECHAERGAGWDGFLHGVGSSVCV